MQCESGLYCVDADGEKKCSACDQNTLNTFTKEVDNRCVTFENGWTPKNSKEYADNLALDGRVCIDAFDKMLENAKKCREARTNREKTCWDGGDAGHIKAINQMSESIVNVSETKKDMIDSRKVYFCPKDPYEGYLKTFTSKCNIDFSDINQKNLIKMNEDQNNGIKVNCSDIEKNSNDCERCFEAAKDLLEYGFHDNLDYFPKEYNESFDKAKETIKKAKELLENVKNKNLCN